MKAVIGIDIARTSYVAHVNEVGTKEFSNDQKGHEKMLSWVKKNSEGQQRLFVMEATSTYHVSCAYFLYNLSLIHI